MRKIDTITCIIILFFFLVFLAPKWQVCECNPVAKKTMHFALYLRKRKKTNIKPGPAAYILSETNKIT